MSLSELYKESKNKEISTLTVNPQAPCPPLRVETLPEWWVNRFLNNKIGEAYAGRKDRSWSIARKKIRAMIRRSKREEIHAEWIPITKVNRWTCRDAIRISSRFGTTECSHNFTLFVWNNEVLGKKTALEINGIPDSITCPISSPVDSYCHVPIEPCGIKNGICSWPNSKGPSYHIPITIDYDNEELARAWFRILGEYASEGYLSGTAMGICGTSKKDMEQTASDLSLLLGREVVANPCPNELYHGIIRGRVVLSNNNVIYRIRICNSPIANMFASICGKGAKNKKIPRFVFTAPYFLKEEFLKSLCRGDAYNFNKGNSNFERNYTKWYKQDAFRLETSSLSLSSGVCLLLATMDKRFSTRYDPVKQSFSVDYVAYRKNSRIPNIKSIPLDNKDHYVYSIEVQNGSVFVDAMGLLVIGG